MPSLGLTDSLKQDTQARCEKLLRRRAQITRPFPASQKQIETLLMPNEDDEKLMRAYIARFRKQMVFPSSVDVKYQYPLPNVTLEWTLTLRGEKFVAEMTDGKMLNRHRLPDAYDKIMAWLEENRIKALQTAIAMHFVTYALGACTSTSQLNWIWPTLLKLDRSGKREQLGDQSVPRIKPAWSHRRSQWVPEINKWLAEGSIMPDLERTEHSVFDVIPLRNGQGSINIYRPHVNHSVTSNLVGLGIEAENG